VPETVPTFDQVDPLLIEYSQRPVPVIVVPTRAIPSTAPLSASVMWSPPALEMIADTSDPALAVSSSVMDESVNVPAVSKTGSVFATNAA